MSGGGKGSRRPALGRGLSSLISTPTTDPRGREAGAPGRRVLTVPIEQVNPRKDQPRTRFDEARLKELAASIEEKGILFPLLVRRTKEGYSIIAGERRWRAAQRAGLQEVPVLIEEADDDEAFELALIENIQREDLNPIEEAEAYQRLLEGRDLTQDALASLLGKERSTIANAVRLLKLPEPTRRAVVEGTLTMGHARALLSLESASAIEKAAAEVTRGRLSVRQTEALVRRQKGGGRTKKKAATKPSAAVKDLVARLERALGARVKVEDRGGKGRLVVEYGSLDDLDRIVETVLGE